MNIRPLFQRVALVLGGLALSLYVIFLLSKNYEGQLQLQQTLQEKFRLETSSRATALGNFFGERLNNVKYLAESRELSIYFTNKALKMSMQYGLRSSLLAIQQRFEQVMEETSIQGKPVFDRLVFVSVDGQVLADAGGPRHDHRPRDWSTYQVKDRGGPRLLQGETDPQVTIVSPYWFKGAYVGELVAWVSLQRIAAHLVEHPHSALVHREAILRDPGGHLLLGHMDPPTVEQVVERLAGKPPATVLSTVIPNREGGELPVVVMRTPIAGTPLSLLTIQPRVEVFGNQATVLLSVVSPGVVVTLAVMVVVRFWMRRRQIEAERTRTLAEAAATYRSIFESANDVIFVLDVDTGRVVDVNGQAMWQFGYTPDEVKVLGIEGLSARDADGRPMSAEGWIEHLRGGDSHLLEWRFKAKSGEVIWAEIGLREGVIGGERRMFAVAREIGGRKRAELELRKLNEELSARTEEARRMAVEAQAAAEAKSRFLATMSHEIRTPMNGVVGMAELLADTELSRRQRRFVDNVRRSADTLLTIINDVLDFSKMEADMIELDDAPFDLRELVDEVAELFAERSQRKGLELVCAVAPNVHTALRGDFGRLRQVFANLLGNAIKFTETGEVSLRVTCTEEDELQCLLSFEVRDTGIGIPVESQERIFDAFAQADGSTTRRHGGTGLGLAICKRLVHLLGGEIHVESSLGAGATFRFTARLLKETCVERTSAQILDALRTLRVLVVDDNATNRSILEEQLAAWGIAHASADGAASAFDWLREAEVSGRPFGLVLLDKEMPGMDGIDLARQIRLDVGVEQLPIVMLSSIWRDLDDGAMRALGICAYLTKPVRQSQLYNTLLRTMRTDHAVEPEPGMPRPAAHNALSPTATGQRILLVEDNPVSQELGREMLSSFGLRVDVAEDGAQALGALQADSYALVLMDCQMPVVDGFEATGRLRAAERTAGQGAHVPVIALTANALSGDREACLEAGMDDYLSKPFTMGQLAETLRRWLPFAPAGEAVSAQTSPEAMTRSEPEPQEPRLDPEALEAVRALQRPGAPDLVRKVVSLYLESAEKLILDLQKAAARRDAEALTSSAHSLKSASANVGATRLSALCRSLEMDSRAGRLDGAETRARAVVEEFRAVTHALGPSSASPTDRTEAIA